MSHKVSHRYPASNGNAKTDHSTCENVFYPALIFVGFYFVVAENRFCCDQETDNFKPSNNDKTIDQKSFNNANPFSRFVPGEFAFTFFTFFRDEVPANK